VLQVLVVLVQLQTKVTHEEKAVTVVQVVALVLVDKLDKHIYKVRTVDNQVLVELVVQRVKLLI
jgi:hypothetical protein